MRSVTFATAAIGAGIGALVEPPHTGGLLTMAAACLTTLLGVRWPGAAGLAGHADAMGDATAGGCAGPACVALGAWLAGRGPGAAALAMLIMSGGMGAMVGGAIGAKGA